MSLDETYRYEIPLTLTLTEIELAAILFPRDQEFDGEDFDLYTTARVKAKKVLDRAVADRLDNTCCKNGCASPAEYEIIPEDTEIEAYKCCQRDLSSQINGPGEIKSLSTGT